MPIRSNGAYRDPAFAQAAENLRSLFAPPSGSEAAGWAAANARREASARLAEAFKQATYPGASRETIDRYAIGAGMFSPTQSYHAVDAEDATKRYGIDAGARTQLATNSADNARARYGIDQDVSAKRYGTDVGARTALATNDADNARALRQTDMQQSAETIRAVMEPVAQGATRFVPPAFAKLYGTAETQVGAVNAGQGDTVTLPDGRTLAGAPKPPSVDEVKAAIMRGSVDSGAISRQDVLDAVMGNNAPVMTSTPNGPVYMSPGAAARTGAPAFVANRGEAAGKMRGEFTQLPAYKNFAQARPIYENLLGTAGRNTKASDLNIVYSVGKLFDPTSVVREGEQIAVRNTSALPDWLQGAIAQLNGGSALTPETRDALLTEAHTRMTAYESALQADLGRYGEIVDRAGLRRDDVLPAFTPSQPYRRPPAGPSGNSRAEPAGSRAAAASPPDLPTPQTAAEFDALPAGTRYRDPDDGRTYRKP